MINEVLIIVKNGTLTEAEQDTYVRLITGKFPLGAVEKVILDVQGEYVDIEYELHRYRNMRKMGGYCIGEPDSWNAAKQAELNDTVPHAIDF